MHTNVVFDRPKFILSYYHTKVISVLSTIPNGKAEEQ